MTMRERIASGKLFTDNCEGLPQDRLSCKKNLTAFNAITHDNHQERQEAITKLFGKVTKVWIKPPFCRCYGTNSSINNEPLTI